MENWTKGVVDFGEQKLGNTLIARFEFIGEDISQIANWKTSCGCTSAVMNENIISVSYTVPSKLPENLTAIGANSAAFRQTVFVNYKNGSQDQLHIKGTMVS